MKTETDTKRTVASFEGNHRPRPDAVGRGSVKAPHSFAPPLSVVELLV